MPRASVSKLASIAIFRTILLSFARVYWRPRLSEGSGPMPRGPCFLFGNHSNRWDPFVLNCFSPWACPTAGVMTREYFRRPFLRWALGSLDLQPARKRVVEPALVRAVHELLKHGEAVVIYPEGGARWTGRPEPWIESSAKMFVRSGYPVYPVLMHGSYVTWPRWATYPRPGRIEVEIQPSITFDPTDSPADALERLKKSISEDENIVEERLRPRWAYRPADGIDRLLYRDPLTGEYGGLHVTDGTMVSNRDGSLRLRMLPDSRLVDDAAGEIHTTADLYEAIRRIPVVANADGVLVQNEVALATEIEFPNLIDEGVAQAQLRRDAVLLYGPQSRREIPLERLQAVDIERNYKLQLTVPDQMVQLSFTRGGSALAWKDAIADLLDSP